MSNMPERIWAWRHKDSTLDARLWTDNRLSRRNLPHVEYVRADLVPAAPSPEVRALVEAAKSGLRFIENTEGELGIVLGCGDALRAALDAMRAEGR